MVGLLRRPACSSAGSDGGGHADGADVRRLVFLVPFYAIEAATVGSPIPVTWGMAAVFLFVATGPAIGAFYFWNRGVAEAGANTAGLYINLLPVFTAILAVLFLGESLHWFHGAGLVLIFSGILLGTMGRRRGRQPQAAAD